MALGRCGWRCWPIGLVAWVRWIGVHGVGIVAEVVEGVGDGEDGRGGVPASIRFIVRTQYVPDTNNKQLTK